MAELSTLARPYARAAFDYARERGNLADWSAQLAICAAIVAEPRVADLLDSPAHTSEQQAEAFNGVCGDATGADIKGFIRVLASNKRLSLLPEIRARFEELKAEQEHRVDVEVVSAFDLDADTVGKLSQALARKLDREVKVSTSTDSGLLGGVLIRAGDLVIDGSVRGRLNKLAEAMNS